MLLIGFQQNKEGLLMPKYTESQQAVIDQTGNNLLVSASAGSGKTTVLIQRIMRKIEAGINIDQLLVVTFTNLAAKHMKQKLEAELNKRITKLMKADTASDQVRRLRQQINLLGVANISTLDAFCLRLIQRYYYVIDLDPVFRLLTDNTEGLLIREQVWNDVREQLYGDENQGPVFAALTSNFSNDRNDDGLSSVVMRLFDFAQSTPDPDDWLDHLADAYQLSSDQIAASDYYQQSLLPLLRTDLSNAISSTKAAIKIAENNELLPKNIEALTQLNQDLNILHNQLGSLDWNTLRDTIDSFKFPRLKKKYPDDIQTAAAQQMGANVDAAKDSVRGINTQYLVTDEGTMLDVMAGSAAMVNALVTAVKQFKAAFAAEKRRRHVLDFGDLEHLALEILTTDSESGRGALQQMRAQFDEVMVDEYQDINSLQEKILQLLSRETPGNMFMVGDVKQSIYQFRLADPLLFLHKYQDYGDNPAHGDRIVLAENFRSVENVDNLTNLIFSQLMDAPVGQIDYDEAAHLKYGPKDYPATMPQTTSVLLYQTGEKKKANQGPAEPLSPEEEANFSIDDPAEGSIMMVAQKILALKAMDRPIYDRGTGEFRPFKYSDVALLVPTRNHNLTIIDIFKRLQIPIVVNDAQNYFQTTEIRIMMALLSVIDNPYQDIPIVTVLRSPIVGLDENQLVYLRIQNKTSDYFQAVRDFHDNYPAKLDHNDYGDAVFAKIDRFLDQLTEFRELARRNQLVTLIWRIYERTGFLDYVGGMPAGKQRQANLNALYERAHMYEQGSFRGLFQFVRFIQKMQDKDQDLAEAVAETETEAVSVMTIHGSKGLEFPVVFVMDMSKNFNEMDTRTSALMDREAGIGITYLDPKQRVKYPTLPQMITKQVVGKKFRAEEMRKLYVAITRAEQQLYLVGTIDTIENASAKWQKNLSYPNLVLSAQARTTAKSDLDWLGMTLIRHPDMQAYWGDEQPAFSLAADTTHVQVELGDADTIGKPDTSMTDSETQPSAVEIVEQAVSPDTLDEGVQEKIQAILNFKYPDANLTVTTAYQSVSEVKRVFEDPDTPLMQSNSTVTAKAAEPVSRYVSDHLAVPQFLQTAQTPSGAEIGSATHLILEQLPLTAPITTEVVTTTIASQVERRVLTADVAEKIDVDSVVGFYASELGTQILAAPTKVHREVSFSLLLPVNELSGNPDDEDHKVLIHGIMDGYLETDAGLILFDYKTDHVEEPSDLLEKYAGQIKLYATALKSIYPGQTVTQYLYSLPQQAMVPVTN